LPAAYALIYLEGEFEDNVYTVQGAALHARADEPTTDRTAGVRQERALPIWSETHGLVGRADLVEFHDTGEIVPVEYKRGAKRRYRSDELQLCAQAFCLEEMFGVTITRGALYHHASRQRREVPLTVVLREETRRVIAEMRVLPHQGTLPPPVNDARCADCSLADLCQPALVQEARARQDDVWDDISGSRPERGG